MTGYAFKGSMLQWPEWKGRFPLVLRTLPIENHELCTRIQNHRRQVQWLPNQVWREINNRFEDIEKEVGQCKQEIKQMKADMIQGGSENSPSKIIKAAPMILSEATREIQSRVERKNNVVVYNMPESSLILKEDVETHDRGVITNMCGQMRLEIKQEEIINTKRLGRKQYNIVESKSVEVPRTVLIALSEHTKQTQGNEKPAQT
jgi:hypothetical protein